MLALFLAGAFLWIGWAWWQGRRDRDTLLAIEAEMTNGRFGIASRKLAAFLEGRPQSGKAAYLLGMCEKERGHDQAAALAWARVVPGSAFSYQAIQAQMRLAEDRGRFADAERLVNQAADDPRNDGTALRVMLVPLYSQLGRIDEAGQLVQARWEHLNAIGEGASEEAIFQLRLHILLTLKPNSVENIRAYLDQAARREPDDDRVWLGRANLAIRTGDLGDARRWLDSCLKRRPDDVPVWNAALTWAMMASRLDLARQALTHLPAAGSTPAQRHRLGAWIAVHRGDAAAEQRELESLVAADPSDVTALTRLAQLAINDGQPDRAAEFERKKAGAEQGVALYTKLYARKQPIRDAVEMAHLAARLGRAFEARAFLTLAIAEPPDDEHRRHDLVRLINGPTPTTEKTQTLAEALAYLFAGDLEENRESPQKNRP